MRRPVRWNRQDRATRPGKRGVSPGDFAGFSSDILRPCRARGKLQNCPRASERPMLSEGIHVFCASILCFGARRLRSASTGRAGGTRRFGAPNLIGERRVAPGGAADRVDRATDIVGGHAARPEDRADFAALGVVEDRLAAGFAVFVAGIHARSYRRRRSGLARRRRVRSAALYNIRKFTNSAEIEPSGGR